MGPLQYSEEFYFGQPRIPATYLDDQDYVFGATQKMEKILPRVAAKGHLFIAVVNSHRAALIGDDLQPFIDAAGLPVPCLALESTGFSYDFAKGFQASVIHSKFADQLGSFLESCVQRPCLINDAGVPIGFEETPRWITSVCESLNADPAPAVADI